MYLYRNLFITQTLWENFNRVFSFLLSFLKNYLSTQLLRDYIRWEPHSDSTDHYKEVNAYPKPKGQHSSSFLQKVKCLVILLQYNPKLLFQLANFPTWRLQSAQNSLQQAVGLQLAALRPAGVYLLCNHGHDTQDNSFITSPLWEPLLSCNRIPKQNKIFTVTQSLSAATYQDLFGTVAMHLRCHSLST